MKSDMMLYQIECPNRRKVIIKSIAEKIFDLKIYRQVSELFGSNSLALLITCNANTDKRIKGTIQYG